MIGFFGIASFIQKHSVNSLYAFADEKEVYVSLGQLEPGKISTLAEIAQSNADVTEMLSDYQRCHHRLINYVMPTDLLVSEVPMFIPEGRIPSHQSPSDMDQSRYKIIYTLAEFGPGESANGQNILLHAVNKLPIVEVWINRETGRVEKIIDSIKDQYYSGMAVPIF